MEKYMPRNIKNKETTIDDWVNFFKKVGDKE